VQKCYICVRNEVFFNRQGVPSGGTHLRTEGAHYGARIDGLRRRMRSRQGESR